MNLPEAWEGFTNKQEGKLRETDPTKHRIKFLKEFLEKAHAKRETREREYDRQMSSRTPLKASAKKGPCSRPGRTTASAGDLTRVKAAQIATGRTCNGGNANFASGLVQTPGSLDLRAAR